MSGYANYNPEAPVKGRIVYQEFGARCPVCGAAEADCRCTPESFLPIAQQTARIQLDRKGRGGKTVTTITGLVHSETEFKALLRQLKAQCGTGGTLRDQTLEIQGDHRAPIGQFLQGLGYKIKRVGGP